MTDPTTPTITRVRSDRPIAKSFTRDAVTGELVKHDPESYLASGEAELIDTPSAGALAELIERLDPADVLILGQIAGHGRNAPTTIKTRKRVEGIGLEDAAARGIVARTKENISYPAGPGWLLIDHDTKHMPEDVRARVEALGGGLAALASIWPDVLKATRVFKPSSSGGVYVEGGSPRVATGFHLFVLVENVSRSAEALKALQARAWAAGLAFYRLSSDGARLERSIVDAAVGSPERLVFTGPPILGPGVRRDPPPVQFWEGQAIPVPDAPSPEEWEPLRDAARAALEPEAVRVTARAYGINEREARERVRSDTVGGNIGPEALIYGPGEQFAPLPAGEIVAGLSKPLEQWGPDPFAGPDKGMTKAIWRWNGTHPAPIVISFAHGTAKRYHLPSPKGAETPAQAIWRVRAAELKDRRTEALREALAGVADVSQIGAVLAVAAALANRVPAQMGREDVIAFLRANLKPGAIPPDWIVAVMARIDWIIDKRRLRALAPVTISKAAREGVEVVRVRELGELAALDGVTVLKAPMAAGKTQRVARPWIAAAKRAEARAEAKDRRDAATGAIRAVEAARDGVREALGKGRGRGVWAICHRVALVEELAQRLDLTSYRAGAPDPHEAAICLPSTTLGPFDRVRPAYVFLDEIQQVLRFLRSQECCRTAKARTPDKVFERLVEIVRGAKGVLVADAGADDSVLDFLRFCRPGETIRLVEMAEPGPGEAGIEATVLTGEKGVYGAAVDQAAEALHKGDRLWIATESAEQAEKVGTHLRNVTAMADRPSRILVVTARNKAEPEQARFLKDPERESRRWDCVIASPVIASGISIEHKGAHHFTLGFYLGTGQALTPADAAQQLRRVRYLRRFVIALAQNNTTGGRSVEAILKGRADAAEDEGLGRAPGAFDHLIARFEAQEADAKADFAAGLWWILESSGWTLSRGTVADGDAADALRQIGRERAEDRARRLIEASVALADYTHDQIDTLRRTAPTGADADLVEAWDLTRALGVAVLTPEDVAFADGGGIGRLDRFDDMAGISSGELTDRDREAALVHRRLRVARRKHFAEIFAGHDPLSPDPWLTRAVADAILDRVMRRADAYAESGAIPASYKSRFGRPSPARPRDPVKAVQAILARAGLGTAGVQVRVSQIPPDCVTESTPICDPPPSRRAAQGRVERRYSARPEDVAEMQRRSAIRHAARENAAQAAHIGRVNRLFDRLDSGGVLYGIRIEGIEGAEIGDVWGRELAARLDFAPVADWIRRERPERIAYVPP